MLARDFIDDSLYNPHYGYFSRQAVLLPDHDAGGKARGKSRDTTESQPALNSFGQGFDFSSMPNEAHFMRAVEERYEAFEATFDRTEPEPPKELPRGVRPSSAEGLEAAQVRGRLLAKQESESVLERDVQAMAARQVWHTPTELFKVS